MDNKLSKPKIIRIKNKKTGVVYLYQNQYYWDSEKYQTRHIRRCIGKLDPKNHEPIYNHRYKNEQKIEHTFKEERVEFIQPTGRLLLLEKVFIQSKLSLHLKKVFSEKEVSLIKDLVFYLVSENNQLSNYSQWIGQNYQHKQPLCFDGIKDLLKTLNKNKQSHFFEHWTKSSSKRNHLLYDLSSESSYKSHNSYLYYGHNRDREALNQNNIIIVTDKKNSRPRNYTILGGNMRDIPTLDILPNRIGLPSLKTSTLVLNRIFYSRERLRSLVDDVQQFLIRVPSQQKWLAELISKQKRNIRQWHSFKTSEEKTLQSCTVPGEKNSIVHIYYEASWAEEQKRNLSNILFACKNELLENNLVDEHQHLYTEYFEIKYSAKGYRRVLYRKDPQKEFEQSNAGYWALLTNSIDDPQQALQTYLTRNNLEAEWDNMKSESDCKHMEVHDPYIFSGRAFLQFLSLVMSSHMNRVLKEHNAGNYRDALATMAQYAKVRFENLMHETSTIPTEKQREIAAIFKLRLRG